MRRPITGCWRDQLFFFLRQKPRFLKNQIGDADLAEIMEQRPGADRVPFRIRDAQGLRNGAGIFADAPAVPGRISIACVQRLSERTNELYVGPRKPRAALANGLRGVVKAVG